MSKREAKVEKMAPLDRGQIQGALKVLGLGLAQLEPHVSQGSLTGVQSVIRATFRRLAKVHHPDHGGDAATFMKVKQAAEQLASVQSVRMFDPRATGVSGANKDEWVRDMVEAMGRMDFGDED